MKRLSVLAINYSSPPMASARAIQVSRLLPALDADVTLFCGIDEDEAIDRTIAPDLDTTLREVIRIPFKKSIAAKVSGRLGDALGARHAGMPDAQNRWNPSLLESVGARWQSISPDVVITFGNPMSTHLAGLELKRQYGIPWVAHFSDPWADNPYRSGGAAASRVDAEMEAEVAPAADALIFTSPETIDLVMQKYPVEIRKKAEYVPHCHDSKIFERFPEPPSDKYIIRSVGTFYGNRTPEPFFQALEHVAERSPELLDGVEIEFAGDFIGQPEFLSKFPKAARIVRVTGRVDYPTALEKMAASHCLINIDAPAEFSVFFPSKLVDYLGAGRFIFAITPPGAAQRIVTAAGGYTASPADGDAVLRQLERILSERPSCTENDYDEYSLPVVADRMMKILARAAGRA